MFNGKEEVSGDITFNVQFADDPAAAAALSEELRVRSQNDPKSIFWVVTLDEEIRNEMREAFRSQQMIETKEPRRVDAGRHGARRRREGPPTPAHGRTEAATEDRGALRPGLVPRQRSQPGRQRGRRQGRRRHPRHRAAPGLRPVQRSLRERRRTEEGRRRALHGREPQRPSACLQPTQPAAGRTRQAGVQDRRHAALRGHGADHGEGELRRAGDRQVPGGRILEAAVRLGLRGRPPAGPVAPPGRRRRGRLEGGDDRQRDVGPGEGVLSQTTTCSGRRASARRRAST